MPGPTSSQLYTWNGALSSGRVIKDAFGNNIIVGPLMSGGAGSGNILASDSSGNLTLQPNPYTASSTWTGVNTFSQSITVPEGSNAYMGTATVNGTVAVTVATTAVTANSRIFMTTQAGAGTVGSAYVSATSAATYFTFQSTSAGDTSTVAWLIINHT